MKILILYTPRCKSTMVHEILSKKFGLESLVDPFTHSKIKHHGHKQFPEIIQYINATDNICVKISSTVFWDSRNRSIIESYQEIDYHSFDKIIFMTRDDKIGATLSYAYMDRIDPNTWHRHKGEDKIGTEYIVPDERISHLMVGYNVYDMVKEYIKNNYTKPTYYEYEFETVNEMLKHDFTLNDQDFDIDLVENGIDYKSLALNYNKVAFLVNNMYNLSLTSRLKKWQ